MGLGVNGHRDLQTRKHLANVLTSDSGVQKGQRSQTEATYGGRIGNHTKNAIWKDYAPGENSVVKRAKCMVTNITISLQGPHEQIEY